MYEFYDHFFFINDFCICTARFKVAEEDLKKCLELDPSFKDAQLNLEQVKKELERDL